MNSDGSTCRVLIVEDESDLAFLMRSILEEEGYEVQTNATGDCFDMVRRFSPDVILCDYMLPRISGQDIVQRVRGEMALATPIIMISAARRASESWREWGADDFLPKPFELNRLIAVVSRAASNDARRFTRESSGEAGEQAS